MASGTKGKTGTRGALTILAALVLLASLAAPSGAYQRPGRTDRVSIASDGSEGRRAGDATGLVKADSRETSISSNGRYVAFSSSADNLVRGDDNQIPDVFVHDRVTAKTELISATSNGIPAVGAPPGSHHPQVSSNGRYVAFISTATNLVPGDSNLMADVFVHDRARGMTERVNVSSQGRDEANGESTQTPSISRDGDTIAFQSGATNLTPSNSPGVFVHERSSRTTEQISDSGGMSPSMSGNGRYVVFTTAASEPGDGDVNATFDVFVHDRDEGSVERVSISSDGTVANQGFSTSDASGRSISNDGRYVAFASLASNLVPNDTNTTIGVDGVDVFVHDRKTHRTERTSVGPAGEEVLPMWLADGEAVIDASGRFVAYSTPGAVVPEDEPDSYPLPDQNQVDVYMFDRATGSPEMVSLSNHDRRRSPCEDGSRRAMSPSLSRAAEQVAFSSCSPDLVSGDGNSAYDIFVRDRGPLLGGGLGAEGAPSQQEDGEDDSICVTPDVCIPPGAAVSSGDATDDLNDVLTKQGANLYGASLAYRPHYNDLFAAIELEHMPRVIPVASPIFYGLRFKAQEKSYEVRATSRLGGTFGLFDCTDSPTCTKVADLRGGYGTTGMRVVFSLPLAEIGLKSSGKLKGVVAFSGLGSDFSGATKVLDRVRLK